MNNLELLYLGGAAIFAATGVLAAARQDMDLLSLVIIGIVTAVGGGTMRDLILDVEVFWITDPLTVYVAAAAAVMTFFMERRARVTEQELLYLDGIATALFAILATEKTLHLGHDPGIALVMGVVTAVGGGLLRDMITGHPTVLMRREIYITPVLAGGLLHLALRGSTDLDPSAVAVASILLVAVIRVAALRYGWVFPTWLTYRGGPGRK
jgi:uncharacterized membrane protein YeiH